VVRNIYIVWILSLISTVILMTAPVSARDAEEDALQFPVLPPPFSEGIFPCSNCHAGMEVNTTKRELEFHQNIKLRHFDGWCFDCHNPDDRDTLRLASGKVISFKESEFLCGQCHGTIFRDWKAGVHGKRTGMWNGRKEYRLCVHCHWPHAPRFKPIKPLPPPLRPEDIKYRRLRPEEIPPNPLEEVLREEGGIR